MTAAESPDPESVQQPCDRMNRIFSVVRSMTEKIIELSRGVVTAPTMGKVTAESESISSTCRW